mmetsp:Transcript_3529/g.3960  ORF Transcript_3529/g.3960 Transcript_3529/m.3960 type:complete len:227 (-) Transcript_3529:291-971(-)
MTIYDQSLSQYSTKVSGTPRCMFRHLSNNSIPCYEARNDMIDRVMERIIPWCDSHNNSQRDIFHPSVLVHHNWPRGSIVGTQPVFSPLANSSNLFTRRQDFSHHSINLRFTRLTGRDATYIFHVINYVLLNRPQYHPALGEGSLSPFVLSHLGLFEYFVDFVSGHVLGVAKKLFCRRIETIEFRLVILIQQCHVGDRVSFNSVVFRFSGRHCYVQGRNGCCQVFDP